MLDFLSFEVQPDKAQFGGSAVLRGENKTQMRGEGCTLGLKHPDNRYKHDCYLRSTL
jgi:hypothetical protein